MEALQQSLNETLQGIANELCPLAEREARRRSILNPGERIIVSLIVEKGGTIIGDARSTIPESQLISYQEPVVPEDQPCNTDNTEEQKLVDNRKKPPSKIHDKSHIRSLRLSFLTETVLLSNFEEIEALVQKSAPELLHLGLPEESLTEVRNKLKHSGKKLRGD